MAGDKIRVLWLEDDSGQFRPVVRWLARQGAEVDFADDIGQARKSVAAHSAEYHIVVIDNIVPGGHDTDAGPDDGVGVNFAEEVLDSEGFKGVVLMLTFFPPSGERMEALRRRWPRRCIVLRDKADRRSWDIGKEIYRWAGHAGSVGNG